MWTYNNRPHIYIFELLSLKVEDNTIWMHLNNHDTFDRVVGEMLLMIRNSVTAEPVVLLVFNTIRFSNVTIAVVCYYWLQ